MREWLSGRAPPCQGGCRGFESRFPLQRYFRTFIFYGKTARAAVTLRRYSQVVRQGSAKPSLPGSNPGGASNLTESPFSGGKRDCESPFFIDRISALSFVQSTKPNAFVAVNFKFESLPLTLKQVRSRGGAAYCKRKGGCYISIF